jgi:hypothetical protein
LTKFPIPTTVSIVAGEILDPSINIDRKKEIARSIFALPHVEPASHGYAHYTSWKEGTVSLKDVTGYTPSLEGEISESIQFIKTEILPPGRGVDLFLWSGDCRPPEAALAMTEELKLYQMNGGDSRWDAAFPSVSYISPLVRWVGGRRQVLAPGCNENLYTDGWSGPFFGYRNVIQTFKNTGHPRRLRPMNIYYHFFSGERTSSLQALKSVYEWALARDPVALFATEYVTIVKDFFSATLHRTSPGAWKILNYGMCRTIRWDQERVYPDLKQCRRVMGFTRESNTLYVHLDSGQEALIVLSEHPPQEPYLHASDPVVEELSLDRSAFSFRIRANAAGEIILANMTPTAPYRVIFSTATPVSDRTHTSNAQGELVIPVENGGRFSVEGHRTDP